GVDHQGKVARAHDHGRWRLDGESKWHGKFEHAWRRPRGKPRRRTRPAGWRWLERRPRGKPRRRTRPAGWRWLERRPRGKPRRRTRPAGWRWLERRPRGAGQFERP